MKDAQSKPTNHLELKLHWPSDPGSVTGDQLVVAELQFVSGLALATMTVPSEQLLQAVAQNLACYALISLDGFVSVASKQLSEAFPKGHLVALDQMVADAVSPEMLEDEPEAAQHLAEFRNRLLKSLELVDQAIASLSKP
jgi:hypothetical protein